MYIYFQKLKSNCSIFAVAYIARYNEVINYFIGILEENATYLKRYLIRDMLYQIPFLKYLTIENQLR